MKSFTHLKPVNGRECLCGQPAVKFSISSWACVRCLTIEASHFGGGDNKQSAGKRAKYRFYQGEDEQAQSGV